MTYRPNRRRVLIVGAILAGVAAGARGQEAPQAAGEPKDYLRAKPEDLQWFREARFGMFVCWGPVSLTGQEIGWSRGGPRPGVGGTPGPTPVEVYDNLYKKWKPDQFDARQWVQVARQAGMKYMIFLVKHHDGFCLYDTKLTDYKSTGPASAWRHDVMADIANACHEAGLKLFIYYSQPDWHHPDYLTENHQRYIQYLHGEIRELLTNYGRIDGLWFDGLRGKAADWDAANLFKMARQIQPWLLINNRCGLPGDFDTPEQHIGRMQLDRPWETCMTLGTQWSWKPDDKVKSLKECIDVLVTCAGRGGNLALNTNPMPDGRIEPRQAERFREIGGWLAKYGESIYATGGGPFPSRRWGVTTHRGDTVYVHVLKWTGDRVRLLPIDRKVQASSVLTGGTVDVTQTDQGLDISVAPEHRQALDTIIVLKLAGPASTLVPILAGESLTLAKPATASSVVADPKERLSPDKAVDGNPETRWTSQEGSRSGWLEVDLGGPATFDRAYLSEPDGRVRRFELQASGDAAQPSTAPGGATHWQTFYRGTTIGEDLDVTFPPVTARRVRVNLLETTDAPSVCEFQLFAPGK